MLEIKQLHKTYYINNKPIKALHDVSLSIQANEIFGIIGASGAGKSTFIRTLNLLERPDCGSVIIDGTDLMTLSDAHLQQWRSQIGMIFQHFNLLESRNVFDNIALPLELIHVSKQDKKKRV